MIFLRIIDTTFFYEYEPITLWDFSRNVLLLLGVIAFFKLISYFVSGKSKINSFAQNEEFTIISPFLIEEQKEGLLYYSSNRKNKFTRIIAIVLILMFIVIPFADIIDQNNFNFWNIFF